jgi:uncharacterized protein
MGKKTVILGASPNPARYSFTAAKMLQQNDIDFIPVGIKKGEVSGKNILNLREKPSIPEVDTVTIYIGPHNQPEWYDYVLSLKPNRVIFNPGAENIVFMDLLKENFIEVVPACTLVMLGSGQF